MDLWLTPVFETLPHFVDKYNSSWPRASQLPTTMKATPLLIAWHEENRQYTPVYSAHFEPHGKGRLATAGGDSNVQVCTLVAEVNGSN